MKTLDLTDGGNLREVLDLASQENLIVTTPDGRRYVVAQIDDFDSEIRLVRGHRELMAFLDQRSESRDTISLDQVKRELNLT
jgi:hypothetical protein